MKHILPIIILAIMVGEIIVLLYLSFTRADFHEYLRARFYLRGWTPLGLFNTLLAALCNRVLVLHKDKATKRVVGFHVGKGTDHPPATHG